MKNASFYKITLLFSLLLSSFFGFAQYTLIPDPNFEQALIDLNIDSGVIDGKVLTSSAAAVISLNISSRGCTNLTGIQDFVSLQELFCLQNPLMTLDVSKNIALVRLGCSNNLLSSLDVSQNIALQELDCQKNRLTILDLSKNTELTKLYCSENQLSNLDLSKNTLLNFLHCDQNRIANLDVSTNTSLIHLSCDENQIANLDISVCTALIDLECSKNRLSNLNSANNTALINFYCDSNQLTNLDVSKNTSLTNFSCSNNQLNSLNLKNGNNTALSISTLLINANPNLTCIQVDNAAYSIVNWSTKKDASASYSENCNILNNTTLKIEATGDQIYCPLTTLKIVETIHIDHDPAETGTEAIYIQISSGYSSNLDKLELSNPTAHPSITTSWDPVTGKLKLSSSTGLDNVLYSDFEEAIKDVVFSNSSVTASGSRTFSITMGQANYLPSTDHYYWFKSRIGVTWSQAKALAEAENYYGLKGYLATILSADEAKLIGEQASGTGWIGGSDAETEGTWKWVTGPEAGTSMIYTFWNTGEPNQRGDEDYAHITQPGVGIKGSWNDLSNTGDPSGNYQPKGYVVEFGGSPGDPILQIATSTKITIPEATPITPNPICDSGSVTINATTAPGAIISWYDQQTGGTLLGTGNSYTTTINTTTTYYVDAGCNSNRKSVTAVVNKTPAKPTVSSPDVSRCGPGSVNLQAMSDIGNINWYKTPTGGTSIYNGANFPTPTISTNTIYYAEASNNDCINSDRTPINIIIYTPPAVTNEELMMCENQKKTLDAGISGMTYKWSTGETTQQIDIYKGGTYTVEVTNSVAEGGCSSTKTIKVEEHQTPKIDHIDVNGTTVTIHLLKKEEYYEFSVDGTTFQDSNVFNNVPGGSQTAYVQEKNGCGGTALNFVVLVFPAFFTPNNDTFNDVWEITGIENYPQAQVTIFDRYGKLLAQLSASGMSWDGTYNKFPLPASDYWYAVKIDNTMPVFRGHFSLKR
ncbi:T9SS type B sorting domain-containing protein [Flavobacterium aquidurense]|uniref:Ig-like domain-containing protein n=1 Tax=Flavobacterium aquidurense TaxID=362413 RepID=UPI00286B1D8C|nr:T9SS type B sorting domain-containing protein [Flavobacterium aquidurense]